jgi:hypothetical protein
MNASLHCPPPGTSRIARNGLRIEIETVRGLAVHVRVSADTVPVGVSSGPRTVFSLSPDDANDLAALLQAHAAEVSA